VRRNPPFRTIWSFDCSFATKAVMSAMLAAILPMCMGSADAQVVTSSQTSIAFSPAAVGVAASSAQTLQASFAVSGYTGSFTPTAAMHYGHDYTVGPATCTTITSTTETCTFPITFIPTLPGTRKDAIVVSNGSTPLITVLVYGIGQAPLAALDPGVRTQFATVGYIYQVAVDENGTAYFLEDNYSRVWSYTKAGVLTQLPITGLSSPHGIAVDGAGTLYIAQNNYGKQIVTYTAAGVQGAITVQPPAPYVPCSNSNGGTLEYLYSVAVDGAGDLFTLEILCGEIFELKTDGTYVTTPISPAMIQPANIAVDDSGDVFISGYDINELPPVGTQTQINTVGASEGIAADASGILYATRYSPGGGFPYGVAELQPSNYSTATLGLDAGAPPLGLGLDSDGTLFVGNYNNLDIIDRTQGAMAFGEQVSGTASATQTIQIVNIGNEPLTVSNIALAGSGYGIQPTGTLDCSNGIVLAPSTYCQVAANVTPTHAGNWNGTITFTSNSLNNAATSQVVNLTAFVYGAYVTASPSPLAFPSQQINTTSTAQTVTFTNQGLIYNAGISAPTSDNTVFAPTLGTCTTGLAPGATCQISVTFTPTAAQGYTGNITSSISSSGGGPNTTATFGVTGTGTAPAAPQAVLTPTTFTFPSTTIGSTTTEAFTLSNPGTAPLTGIVTTLSGANTADYSISNNCSGTLPAGSTCSVTVNFIPQATGTFTATVNVADNATGSPQTAIVSGTGTPAPAPAVTFSPTSLTFASTQVGSTSSTQTIMVMNSGNAPLTLSSINITGANPTDFNLVSTTCSTTGGSVAAGSSCGITLSFTPASAITFAAGITIADNATGSPQTAPLSGTGTPAPAPAVTFSPTSFTFASTQVGSTSSAQIIVTNSGNAPLTLTSITITGANPTDFNLVSTTCSTTGGSVAVESSCSITVSFTPASATTFTAGITIADNATGSPQTAPLSGTGTPAPAPQAVLTPSSLSFPSTTVGAISAVQTLTLSNSGNASLSISSITVTGANAADFARTTTCSASLAAGSTCTISVTFAPASAASFTAAITVTDNATGSPQTSTLTGTGTPAPTPQAVLTPSSLSFPSTTVGATSAAQTLTLSNPGTATLSISGVIVTGANTADFAETSNCSTSLAAGATCTINVTFTPASAASFSASVSVADSASGSPQAATVSGTGAAPAAADFTTSSPTAPQTVTRGGAAQYTIAVQPSNGSFTNAVTLSATGLPPRATASFQPASVTPGSTGASSTMTIQTVATVARSIQPKHWPFLPPGITVALIVPLFWRRLRNKSQRARPQLLLGALVFALLGAGAAFMTGCGAGFALPSTSTTYTITVTGTSGSDTHSTTVSLILK
jgi:hypothetical protein